MFTPPLAPLEPRSEVTERRTLGYAACDFARDELGVELHPWQQWLLVHMLELTARGHLRFRTAVVLVARQNGKTTLSVVVALFFMYMLGRKLVLGTAQDLDVAEEIWQSALDLITEEDEDERPIRPQLKALVSDITLTNGKKAFELKTREKYKVKATNRGAGRSLSADLLLLDELREHYTWAAWAALSKTQMARSFALTLCLSNAGTDKSVVLNRLRLVAHLALGNPDDLPTPPLNDDVAELLEEYDDDLFIAEWSPPPGCALNDREAWTYANPSLGSPVKTENVVTEKAIANALRTCLAQGAAEEAEFRAEVLCQWPAADSGKKLPFERWAGLSAPGLSAPAPCGYALDVDEQRQASICAAGVVDGRRLVFVVATGSGTGWVVPKLQELQREKGLRRVKVSPGLPSAALIPAIEAAGIEVDPTSGPQMAAACGDFLEATVPGAADDEGEPLELLAHLDDPLLNDAVLSAETRAYGEVGWVWVRKGATSIGSLVAGTLAVAESRTIVPAFFAAWR